MPLTHYARLTMVAVMLAIGLPSGAMADPPSLDPCALLSADLVASVLGVSTGDGVPIGATGCLWSSRRTKALLSLADASGWEEMRNSLSGVNTTAAVGIGDDAFFTTTGVDHSRTSLSVRLGAVAFVLQVFGVAELSRQLSMEKSLAAYILAKLPGAKPLVREPP